jgi:hypothetical protein
VPTPETPGSLGAAPSTEVKASPVAEFRPGGDGDDGLQRLWREPVADSRAAERASTSAEARALPTARAASQARTPTLLASDSTLAISGVPPGGRVADVATSRTETERVGQEWRKSSLNAVHVGERADAQAVLHLGNGREDGLPRQHGALLLGLHRAGRDGPRRPAARAHAGGNLPSLAVVV